MTQPQAPTVYELDRKLDIAALGPVLACAYATVVGPLLQIALSSPDEKLQNAAPNIANRLFWPILTFFAVLLTLKNLSRLREIAFPQHIVLLFVYAAFAGMSVTWAFKPEISLVRYLQQLMILTSIILPGLQVAPRTDLVRGVFVCFAAGATLNFFFVFTNSYKEVAQMGGYQGYFSGKNALGEFSAAVVLLSIHEIFAPGARRLAGLVILILGVILLFWANSKTAIALTVLAPTLSGLTLLIKRQTRLSVALILLFIPVSFFIVSTLTGVTMNRISYIAYGDSTFTGRTVIWSFAELEIARSPIVGWGYQSFWLVGQDAPSVVRAPGWVKTMPNAHNGYVDTLLELGYIGYVLLLAFVLATLHATGRISDRAPFRAWVVLSIVIYIIIYNYLESLWMRGFEFMWVLFVIMALEAGRNRTSMPTTDATAPNEIEYHNTATVTVQPPQAGWVRRVWVKVSSSKTRDFEK